MTSRGEEVKNHQAKIESTEDYLHWNPSIPKKAIQMKEMYSKICMLGDPGVGKTSLVRRFVLDVFDDDYIPSIGMKVTKKSVSLEDDSLFLTLMIWDILGSKTNRFDSIYYKGVKGALLVSDVTRENTLDSLPNWISGLYDITDEVPIVFLANKIDLESKKEKLSKKLSDYTDEYSTEYHFTSAKTGENVEGAFFSLAKMLAIKGGSDILDTEIEEEKGEEGDAEEGEKAGDEGEEK
ncbi:MAG: GTP-binding protein [Thermoplasmata archaeon]|nr:MAG: GTP-binding protein [Thermoplasmata archaeon]